MADIAAVRDQEFPVVQEITYLNAASQGPYPNRTVAAVQEVHAIAQFPNTARARTLPNYEAQTRDRLARLIGADEADLVFTSNTTHGMNICAQGIDWRPGDNVVVPDREFPSLSYAWYHLIERGVEVRFVPFAGAGPTVTELMTAADDHTRAVACSAITWNTGWRANLEELGQACADRGILLIVDGIQAVGARQLDVKAMKISAMAIHGYKWLCSGFGLGALYVSPEARNQIAPTFIGSQSVISDTEEFDGYLNYRTDAGKYAAGGLNRSGLAAMATSLGLIEELDIEAIEAHNRTLAEAFYAAAARKSGLHLVSSPDPAYRSAVTVFTLGDRQRDAALVDDLEKQGIIVALRPLGVRVSPHFYNTEAEVARLINALPN